MADPFTGLGIASNIICVVDFTWKLFSSAHEIYNSSTGASEGNAVVHVIAGDISKLSGRIAIESATSKELQTLSEETKRLADDLLTVVEKLKAKGPGSRWKSFKVALKEVHSRGQINGLYDRLSRLQARITAHIQYILGNRMSAMSLALQELTDTTMMLRLDMKKFNGMERSIEDVLQATKAIQASSQSSGSYGAPPGDLLQLMSSALESLGTRGSTITLEKGLIESLYFPLIQTRQEEIAKAHGNTCAWVFEDNMPESQQELTFGEWLCYRNGIFWIRGKPGCGKSTLMKFICDNSSTTECLDTWARANLDQLQAKRTEATAAFLKPTKETLQKAWNLDDMESSEDENFNAKYPIVAQLGAERSLVKAYENQVHEGAADDSGNTGVKDSSILPKLVVAKYFFWNAGSKLQKSQEGLLRTLLFEIIRQCPELITHISKARLAYRDLLRTPTNANASVSTAPWSIDELLTVLESAIEVRISANFCFFIDGLDEYEEENKQTFRSLVDTLNRIANFPNTKICVASRPWTIFVDAFNIISRYSLKLEDLTREDIRRYVSDTFKKHEQFKRLSSYNSGYVALIDEVTTRARGVFLWVYLVVRDLLDGLTYHDTVRTMFQRLEQFPEDLEDFFQHMVDCIPKVYRHQSARTFIATMEAPGPLLLMLHSFLDDVEADPRFCVKKLQFPLAHSEIVERTERMKRQLEGRSKGLLEIVSGDHVSSPYFASRVDFLHRTVRDFLQSSPKVQLFISGGKQQDSSLWVLMCRGVLAQIRYAPFSTGGVSAEPFNPELSKNVQKLQNLGSFMNEFAYFAKRALQDPHNEQEVVSLYKEAEKACSAIMSHAVEKYNVLLLKVACQYGLLVLVERASYDWSNTSIPAPPSEPLLRAVMHPDETGGMHENVVAFLLGKGADPNQFWERSTHFQALMQRSEYREIPSDQPGVAGVVRSMIIHGADLDTDVSPKNKTQGANDKTALEVVKEVFSEEQAQWILGKLGSQAAVSKTRPPNFISQAVRDSPKRMSYLLSKVKAMRKKT